jgi:hypothetical protein
MANRMGAAVLRTERILPMNRSISALASLTVMTLAAFSMPGYAQDNAKPLSDKTVPSPERSPYRQLVPGVMQTINPMQLAEETVSRHDLVELVAKDSKFTWAQDLELHRDVWVLTFQFKPIRMIWVDIPQPSGYMQRKPIWYMIYSVTNTGKTMHPVEEVDLPFDTEGHKKLYKVEHADQAVRFTPEFLLEAHVRAADGKHILAKTYADRVIPVAIGPIRMREDPNRRFLSAVEICREIKVGETLWGIATWEDIDPKLFEFSVYVGGLTNAYRRIDEPGAYKPDDPVGKGRKTIHKTLKLNFWRPGDQYLEHEDEIRYGRPGGLDYEWVYR